MTAVTSLTTDPSKPALNVKEPMTALLKAAGEAAFLNGGGTISNIIDAAGALGREEETGAQAAHSFWRAVLAYAVMDVIGRNKIADLKTDSGRLAKVTDQFGPVMEEAAAYDLACLQEPTSFKPYQGVREQFWDMVNAICPDREFEKDLLERQLDNGLREGVWKIWCAEKSAAFRDYANSVLTGPVAEGISRRMAWQRHYSWIDHRLSKEPVFGQEEAGITLRDVYVPLRSNFHTEVPIEGDDEENRPDARRAGPEAKTRRVANVGWLEETVKSWLDGLKQTANKRELQDTLRVVAGPPGGGKSVFSRVIAHDVAMAGRWNVAYAELQHMSFKDDFRDRIRAYFEPNNMGAGLGDDIFQMLDVPASPPVLFVFDGLDELSHSEDAAKDVSRKFIRNVKEMLSSLNRNGLRAAALVLGRSVAVKEALSEAELPISTLLHVMSLKPLDQRALEIGYQRSGGGPDDVKDPEGLLGEDYRHSFWKTWLVASSRPSETRAAALENEKLDDLTAEPLLFYLLILSGYADESADRAADNRNQVYQEIFRRVHERDKHKAHSASHGLDEDGFLHLMECLGLAIWQGGGRTGEEGGYGKYRKLHGFKRKRAFEDKEFASLKNVTSQFYTREVGGAEKGFEFVHKSFGEYLAGCSLLRAAEELAHLFEDDDETFCVKWLDLFGAQPVTPEVLQFLKDEVRLQALGLIEPVKEKLTKHMNWVLKNGFPANSDSYGSWRIAETHQRNATGALLAVLNALASAQGKTLVRAEAAPAKEGKKASEMHQEALQQIRIRPDWPDPLAPRRLIEQLHITHGRTAAHHLCLGWFDFAPVNGQNCGLQCLGLHFADLRGANLMEADLSGANLIWANLGGANL
ncbi:MAG: pentapeptide repeat-containing protein, partial [Flavobacteriaceae bacterium]|nr:pentapeptide repeat-containing protein [Flavobacteriaceae bacterium]